MIENTSTNVIDEDGHFLDVLVEVIINTKYAKNSHNNFFILKTEFNDNYLDFIKSEIEKTIIKGKYEIVQARIIDESKRVPF